MTPDEILATVRGLPFRRFHNALRSLVNIDGWMLEQLGVSKETAERFVKAPEHVFVTADDETKAAIWKVLERRQPDDLRESV
jgi:hypothetical protein